MLHRSLLCLTVLVAFGSVGNSFAADKAFTAQSVSTGEEGSIHPRDGSAARFHRT